MKSRRLLAILIIFIVLAGTAVIGGTVFVISDIEVNFISTESFTDEKAATKKILSSVEYLKGKNILFNVKEMEIRDIIENTEKLVKVKNIKAEFPNKIVIDIRERYPVYKYESTMGYTIILDAEMRVLYKDAVAKSEKELIDISNAGINFGLVEVGDFAQGLSVGDNKKIEQLSIVSNYFYNRGNQEASKTHLIRKIIFDDSGGSDMLIMRMEVKPQGADNDTNIRITTKSGEDFSRLLAYIWATMESPLSYKSENVVNVILKPANDPGNYEIAFNSAGKLVVAFDKDKDGVTDALFWE